MAPTPPGVGVFVYYHIRNRSIDNIHVSLTDHVATQHISLDH